MKVLSGEFWRDVFDPALIIKTTLQTIIGTLLVGLVFMVFTDFVFDQVDMSGRWNLELKPEKAMSKKNQCVDITYNVLFTQEGTKLVGAGEKAKDAKSTSPSCKDQDIFEREIDPGKGKRIRITGYVTNNYITKDAIAISYQERDQENLRFTMVSLDVISKDKIVGWYKSNISRAEGSIILSRVR